MNRSTSVLSSRDSGGAGVPDLLAFCVAPDDAVDERRLARLGVRVVVPDRVDFDVLGVVHVDELLVDVRPVGAGEVEVGIQLAGLVPDLYM